MTEGGAPMKYPVACAALFAIVLGLATMPADAACFSGSYLPVVDNQVTTGVIRVRAGSPCTITLGGSRGPMYETIIARRPEHGVARVEGMHRVVYVANRNYKGRDFFVYQRRGLDMANNRNVRTIRVRVLVWPYVAAKRS
jgi:hypothetical protein